MIIDFYSKYKGMTISDFVRYGCQLAVAKIDDELDALENGPQNHD
jgi:hypothetical protein